MKPLKNSQSFQHSKPSKIGLLLINLGTPDHPDTRAVKNYLRIFLSDSRVVEIPKFIWFFILHGIILPFRSPKSAAKYRQIWTPEGSPLLVNSRKQANLLTGYLGEKLRAIGLSSDCVSIKLAMRYGNPSISQGLQELRDEGCQKILSVPLYPQYAASTTASAYDALFNTLQSYRWQPAIRTIASYHDFSPYIQALANRIRQYWQQFGQGDILVLSFHGIPRFALEKGDPYFCFCQKTGRLLIEELKLAPAQYRISFQSRFGRTEWLQPYTTDTLHDLASKGTKRVDIFCPGFVSDCLETLEEIAMEGRDDFLNAGGKEYHYISALNDFPEWINALAELCMQELQGWLPHTAPTAQDLQHTLERAQKLGSTF